MTSRDTAGTAGRADSGDVAVRTGTPTPANDGALERGDVGLRGLVDVGGSRSSSAWSGVQPDAATLTRVCAYDRASRGKSDRSLTPYDVEMKVRDLHTLLATAEVPGPYVLVGHSFGGLVAQVYASTYSQEVAGMVLVDSSHPGYYFANRDHYTASARQFDIDLLASAEQVERAAQWPVVPLVVLSRGKPFPAIPGGEEQWAAGQAALAARMPNGVHRVVPDADYSIPNQQPQAIVAAIREVVDAIRAR